MKRDGRLRGYGRHEGHLATNRDAVAVLEQPLERNVTAAYRGRQFNLFNLRPAPTTRHTCDGLDPAPPFGTPLGAYWPAAPAPTFHTLQSHGPRSHHYRSLFSALTRPVDERRWAGGQMLCHAPNAPQEGRTDAGHSRGMAHIRHCSPGAWLNAVGLCACTM